MFFLVLSVYLSGKSQLKIKNKNQAIETKHLT